MKNNAWRTFFIGIFFCLMIGLAFGGCISLISLSGDYELEYEEEYEDG